MNYVKVEYANGEIKEVEVTHPSLRWFVLKLNGIRPIKIEFFGDIKFYKDTNMIMRMKCHPMKTDYDNFLFLNNVNKSKS